MELEKELEKFIKERADLMKQFIQIQTQIVRIEGVIAFLKTKKEELKN